MKLAIYVPHGAVPDKRGFAPAIVAWNHACRLKSSQPFIICAQEHETSARETTDNISIYRIGEGRLYRRLFRKITCLDPYPLHRRAAKIVNRELPDLFHAHQLEFPVADFLKLLKRTIPVLVHAHVTASRFEQSRGAAYRYLAASQHVKEKLVRKKISLRHAWKCCPTESIRHCFHRRQTRSEQHCGVFGACRPNLSS